MKKIAIAMLAATILMGACGSFAGCKKDKLSTEIDWNVDLSKPIEIKALYPSTGISAFGSDDTASIIQKNTGYHVTYTEVPDSNADNEINNILATNGEYHVLKLTEAQYHPYLESSGDTEMFLDLTELLQKTESGRKIYDIINLMPYGWDSVKYTQANGKTGIYAIPDFGYCVMEDSALVWNNDHLKKIGYVNEDGSVKTPSTVAEVTDALEKLQNRFGTDSSYHALSIPGSNGSNISSLMAAFDCPLNFYVDADGNIQNYIYSDGVEAYVNYMSSLRRKNILSNAWQQSSSEQLCQNFAKELTSCVSTTYWWVTPLINAAKEQGKIAASAGLSENTYESIRDNVISWATRVRGDGTNGSPVQEKAKTYGDLGGVSYYTVIPWYMAKDAVYIIDWLGKKLETFDEYYGGTEGVHWKKVDAPEGAKDYYPDGDYGYQAYENYSDSLIYLRPYSYSYRVGEAKADGSYDTKTVSGGGCWVQLTKRYVEHIVNNSQYCNGTNSVAANVLFHLRETGFDAWQVAVPYDETCVSDPMGMCPPMHYWAPISILARTVAKRGIATAIDSNTPSSALSITRASLKEKYLKQNGKKYYYWSDDIVKEMTEWYKNVKLNRS